MESDDDDGDDDDDDIKKLMCWLRWKDEAKKKHFHSNIKTEAT